MPDTCNCYQCDKPGVATIRTLGVEPPDPTRLCNEHALWMVEQQGIDASRGSQPKSLISWDGPGVEPDHLTPPEGYDWPLGWKLEGMLFRDGWIEGRSDAAREMIEHFIEGERDKLAEEVASIVDQEGIDYLCNVVPIIRNQREVIAVARKVAALPFAAFSGASVEGQGALKQLDVALDKYDAPTAQEI